MNVCTKISLSWFQEGDASPKETLFFNDGRRRIDFVLVYKDTEGDNKSRQRRLFEDNLITAGLKIEIEDKERSPDKKTYYTKLHAPWAVLARMAEFMRIKVPIKEYDQDESSSGWLSKIPCNPFTSNLDMIPEDPYFFTADYNEQREDR